MNAVLGGLSELPPEQILRWQSGWSRRINDEHRMVYKATTDALLIAQLRYHY